MKRFTSIVASAIATGILVALACGGRLQQPGTLDDAGVYRIDGAVIFGPGSFCESEAGAVYAQRPTCDIDASMSEYGGKCREWIKANFPYAVYSTCDYEDGSVRCHVQDFDEGVSFTLCDPGEEGDTYCSAFYQQFVVNGGRALAHCNKCVDVSGQECPAYCTPGIDHNCPYPCQVCVDHGGKTGCENLCAP